MSDYPKWAMNVSTLREWAKYRHLRQKHGRFRLVISDDRQPLGELTIRPHLLRYLPRERAVVGRFKLERVGSEQAVWLEAPYYRSLGAFIYHAPVHQVDLASCAAGARYYEEKERREIQKILAAAGDQEEWLTAEAVPQPSSSSTQRSATSPFGSLKAAARGKLPTEQRLFPA